MQPPTTMMKIEVFLSYLVLNELHSGGAGGGSTRYILGWGGAAPARPLIP